MADTPYAPYYPGDDYVDWVALTQYHFGHAWPYGENEVPEAGKFAQQLRGTYTGTGTYENQSALPDFYQQYAVDKNKPLALAETGALYNETPTTPGASELEIKRAWIDQVYSSQSLFPRLKLINWFEIRKYEAETKSYIDWRATVNPDVTSVLKARITQGKFVFASAEPTPEPALTAPGAPTGLATSAPPNRIVVSWAAPTDTGGSPITGYVACRVGSSLCLNLSASTHSASFTSLARRTSYTFAVRAVNKVGEGAEATVTGRTK